jgi:hypothetical protein
MALHTDDAHPHVHVVLKGQERAGTAAEHQQVAPERMASEVRGSPAGAGSCRQCDTQEISRSNCPFDPERSMAPARARAVCR